MLVHHNQVPFSSSVIIFTITFISVVLGYKLQHMFKNKNIYINCNLNILIYNTNIMEKCKDELKKLNICLIANNREGTWPYIDCAKLIKQYQECMKFHKSK